MGITKKNGFTLIELIVAVAIFSIIMIPITSLLISVSSTFKTSERLSTAQAYSNLAMDIVKRELSTATKGFLCNDINFSYPLIDDYDHKCLYTENGIIILKTVTSTSTTDRQILKKPDLDGLKMKCNLSFESSGGKSVTVIITILDKNSNSVIYKLTSIVFLQNTSPGITVNASPGTVVKYTSPS